MIYLIPKLSLKKYYTQIILESRFEYVIFVFSIDETILLIWLRGHHYFKLSKTKKFRVDSNAKYDYNKNKVI